MAQPNVAREPSMEEILASIRRIIESNEPPAEDSLQRSLPPVYAEEDFDEEELGMTAEVAANDPGQPAHAEPARRPFSEPEPERSLSLADVAARVRAGADRAFDNRPGQFPMPAPAVAAFPDRPAARQPEQVVSYPQPERLIAEPRQQPVREEEPAPAVTAPAEPVRAPVAAVAERSEPQSLPARIESAASLMSEEAGAQVSRSFGELAAAFDGIQNRSLEDLAQEMLRPMLQDWLDDNLPTLVERLVREEIERVARGPRR
ncbi:MAG: PopZ family protein [Pseudomonadota bacterium]|nr:PopZ family protein [Pseudomonadota bacterium]